jgi:hypothetical protein
MIGYALVWLPAAALAVYMKWVMLDQIGYLVVARSLGRERDALTWFERARLYMDDVMIGFVVLPVALILVLRMLPRALRAPTVLAVTFATLSFLFINLLSFANVGRFMTPSLASDGLQWLIQNPSYLTQYVSTSAWIKFAVLAAGVLSLSWLARRLDPAAQSAPHTGKRGRTRLFAGITTAVVIAPFLHLGGSPGGYAVSIFRQATKSALSLDRPRQALALDSPEELRRTYRELANLPPYQRADQFFGTLADFDVLFFVFETTPSQVLDFQGASLAEFPNLRRLVDGSLIAPRHHTTFPYTYSALFSLFSGWYPTGASYTFRSGDRLTEAPFARLTEIGYQAAVYSPIQSQFTDDREQFSALGFQHYVLANDAGAGKSNSRWERTVAQDRATLALLKQDMTGWLREGQRFAAVFLPQASHGPWPDITGTAADNHARGRAILAYEDAWLGELIDLLQQYDRLDHTLIIVTADHGLRTREEEPTLPPGLIDDISFRVPLLLYAPKVFRQPMMADWLTSHVDLAPTLLDLLGLPGDREAFQGLPLWDGRLADRRAFLLANEYFGADGLHDEHGFYMYNDFLGVHYAAPRLEFGKEDLIYADDHRARTGRAQLELLVALQERWLELFTTSRRGAEPAGTALPRTP